MNALGLDGLELLKARLEGERSFLYGVSVKNIGGSFYVHVFGVGVGFLVSAFCSQEKPVLFLGQASRSVVLFMLVVAVKVKVLRWLFG